MSALAGFATSPSGLRPPGLADIPKPKHSYIPPPGHMWRRTFLLCVDNRLRPLDNTHRRVQADRQEGDGLIHPQVSPPLGGIKIEVI